jgi:signal transduction histidine kinase
MTHKNPTEQDLQKLHSRIAELEDLIAVYENSVVDQTKKLYAEIAERKQAEEQVRRLNVALEKKVAERTGQLLEAQEELERKEKLAILGQLSGSVSHELRNPLGVMNNAVYFLKMVHAEGDEVTLEYLDILQREIDNSQRIIADLLDFARTKPPQLKTVSAAKLIRRSLEKCALADNITATIDVPNDLPKVHIDPQQMEQVLINLFTNAEQAMAEGGCLRIGARMVRGTKEPASGPRGDFLEISVADTGEGISAENMRKLFQPLFTTKQRGIGLGLVVCKNLVVANGGRIEVVSEAGKGTTFRIIMPVTRNSSRNHHKWIRTMER